MKSYEYNCYGYAVGIYEWLLIEDRYSGAVNELLEKFPYLKLVTRDQVVLGKEYIAFRYTKYDFHFMKRSKQGYWRHKMGSQPAEAIATKDVFASNWDNGIRKYNSKLYLFEVLPEHSDCEVAPKSPC